MSRRYRFLTNPRFFSFFTEKNMNLVQFFIIFITFTTVVNFWSFHFMRKDFRAREAQLKQDLIAANPEGRGLKAAENKRNGPPPIHPCVAKGLLRDGTDGSRGTNR